MAGDRYTEIGAKYQVAKDPMAGRKRTKSANEPGRETTFKTNFYVPVRPVFDRLRGILPCCVWSYD